MLKHEQALLERQRRLSTGTRRWGPPGIDLDVAAHEAGHTVVSWLRRLNPTRATIEPGLGFDGMVTFGRAATGMDRKQAFDHAVALMAGNAAEKLLGGPADCGKDDLRQARALLEPFCRSEAEIDDMIADARRSARRMLKAHAGPLIAIITALLAERTLDAEQISEIMTPADDDDDDDGDDGGMTLAEFMAGGGEESRVMSPRLVQYRVGPILYRAHQSGGVATFGPTASGLAASSTPRRPAPLTPPRRPLFDYVTAHESGNGAISEVAARQFARAQFLTSLRANPERLWLFLEAALQETNATRDHMLLLGRGTAEEKFADFIIIWRTRAGVERCSLESGAIANVPQGYR